MMTKPEFDCVICGGKSVGFGNNPIPISFQGRCCDDCNAVAVIAARLFNLHVTKKAQDRRKLREAAEAQGKHLPDLGPLGELVSKGNA